MKRGKKIDLIWMILFPIFATIISFIFKTNFLISTLLFFGLPSIYLSIRNKHSIKKTLIFTTISSIPLGIIIDYFGTKDGSWYVPESAFSFRLFGFIPIDDLIWGFLLVYFIVIFYEHFLDKKGKRTINKKFTYFGIVLIILTLMLMILHILIPSINIPYFYLLMGILLFTIPIITFLYSNPKFIPRYVKISVYFFSLFLIHELVGMQLSQWTFPGENFIGWVKIFGHSFPFEEFIFFISLSTIAILTYYEYFADDLK